MTTTIHAAGPLPGRPSKSLLRRPTLTRKRGDGEDSDPLSPSKRSKVTFDSDVEVRVVEEWEKTAVVVQEEVQQALQKHSFGDDRGYNRIKEMFSPEGGRQEKLSHSTIRNYTLALANNTSFLGKSSSDLVHIVLNSEWLARPDDYVKTFQRLLANLITAQGSFLADVFRMLIENMAATPSRTDQLPGLPKVPRSCIHVRVHKTLRYLIKLVPSASRVISSIAAETFPYESNSKRAHIIYIKNILKMIEYAPELKLDMLGLITERLVKIDVQVQVDLEDLADDIGEGLIQEIPHFAEKTKEDLHESDIDDDSDSDNDEDHEAQRTNQIVKNVEKMDHILDILFSYYDQVFLVESAANWSGILDLLLSQFTTIILPTHRSRHTQFLLFHFVQKSPNWIDTFVGMCIQISFDQHRPAIVRQAAASYLASFVARGVHVPSDIVRDVWDYISNELTRLRQNYEPNCRGPDLGRYSTYYALVQALLYIFCFRWRDLEARSDEDCDDGDMPGIYNEEHQWRSGVKETLNLNLFSPQLNPLKVCSPAIVTEFARIAHHLGIIYVGHRLESNRRLRLSQFSGPRGYGGMMRETALNSRKDEEHYQLDEYFPFDPYHLPRSKRWINNDYREWTGIPGLEDEEASQSESEDEVAETNVEEVTETDETDES